jgi:hypothetical protein
MFHYATKNKNDELVIGVFYKTQLVAELVTFISEVSPGTIQVDVHDSMGRCVGGWTDYIEEGE